MNVADALVTKYYKDGDVIIKQVFSLSYVYQLTKFKPMDQNELDVGSFYCYENGKI